MVIDRAIRGSTSVLRVPAWVLATHAKVVIEQIVAGQLDSCLAQLRAVEMRGQHRPSIIQAIDARSKRVMGGE